MDELIKVTKERQAKIYGFAADHWTDAEIADSMKALTEWDFHRKAASLYDEFHEKLGLLIDEFTKEAKP